MINGVYADLGDFERITDRVPGGITSILFIPIDDVYQIGPVNPATKKIDSILLYAGMQFFTARIPDQGKNYDEAPKTDDGGTYYEITVNAVLPFNSANNHLRADIGKYYEYIVIVKTQDGLLRVVGNLEDGALFNHSYTSGANSGDKNAAAIQFTFTTPDKPPLLSSLAAITDSLATKPGHGGSGS